MKDFDKWELARFSEQGSWHAPTHRFSLRSLEQKSGANAATFLAASDPLRRASVIAGRQMTLLARLGHFSMPVAPSLSVPKRTFG
jgi:hypothetical protein